jgi:catechol 2,3-dioxygenase-like lactoylglutathione lyase family enzyme
MRDRRTRPKRIPQHKERLGRVAITGQLCRRKVVCTSTSCDFYNVYLAWDPTSEPQWKSAFAISAGEVDAWRERLQSHGVSIEGEMEWPRCDKSLYFRDPDGHLVELATPGLWSIY